MGYNGKQYGDPVMAIRLPPEMVAAVKICARQHGQDVSSLVRQLIREQLDRDGIPLTSRPIQGQRDIDDYILDSVQDM